MKLTVIPQDLIVQMQEMRFSMVEMAADSPELETPVAEVVETSHHNNLQITAVGVVLE